MLTLKLVLAPSLIAAVTLVGRRWGHKVGGLVTALPVVAGPTLGFYAVEQGNAFAAQAAHTALLGLVGVAGFCLVYARVCRALTWFASLGMGTAVFVLATAVLYQAHIGLLTALVLTLTSLALAVALLPAAQMAHPPAFHSPWDLPLRMCAAGTVVWTLTTLAEWLGPSWSGLLASFPVATTIIASFTHAQHGARSTVWFFRGLLPGLAGFAMFCFVLATALGPWHLPLWSAAGAALATQVSLQSGMLWWISRGSRRSYGSPAT